MIQVAQKIKEGLKKRKMNITQLADEVGLSRQQVSSIVNGQRKAPVARIKNLLRALEYSEEITQKLAKEYEFYYKHIYNNKDFRFRSMKEKYHFSILADNPAGVGIGDGFGDNSPVVVIEMKYKSSVLRMAISLKGEKKQKKDHIEFFYFKGSTPPHLKIDSKEFCKLLDISSEGLLKFIEHSLLQATKETKYTLSDNLVPISKDWVTYISKASIRLMDEKKIRKKVDELNFNIKNLDIKQAYMAGAKNLETLLLNFLETEREGLKSRVKYLPRAYEVFKKKIESSL
jgi:transcriptional regulator with XRE-family HTH domain